MKTILTHIFTATIAGLVVYLYLGMSAQLEIAKLAGKVEVMSKFCEPELERTGIVSKKGK